jgi:hypothetical protein
LRSGFSVKPAKENPNILDPLLFALFATGKLRKNVRVCPVMVSRRGWTSPPFWLAFWLLIGSAGAASPPKQDRSWKQYRNQELGYCVSYPSRWLKGDAFEGGGFYVATGLKKHSRPLGEIDVGVLPPLSVEAPHTAAVSLIENLQAHLDGLKTFERARNMEVLETRSSQFLGSPALFTKDRYYDPQDRHTWIDEVVFVQRANRLFRLELECAADQIERFEPVFTHLLSSFQFECGTAQ